MMNFIVNLKNCSMLTVLSLNKIFLVNILCVFSFIAYIRIFTI